MLAGNTFIKLFTGISLMLDVFDVFKLIINIVLFGYVILVSLLQAYVFTILTCLYLRDAVELH